jgi:acetylxylan esterase
MASPRHVAGQPYNIGRGSDFNGNSPRSDEQLSDLNAYENTLALWCNAGDPVCAVGSEPVNITAHWSYYDQYTEVASRWLVATVLGHTDEKLDLDGDGQDESVDLTGSPPVGTSRSANGSSGGDQNAAPRSVTFGIVGGLGGLSTALVVATLLNCVD